MEQAREIHPNSRALLEFFRFDHLPKQLQLVSQPFAELAFTMAQLLDGPELTVGLRKLLESKDCMVRAAVAMAGKDKQ